MPLKILVAEDEEDLIEQYKMVFRERGHHVVPAKTGVEAINRYRLEYGGLDKKEERPFDVVIIDYSMPLKDGATLATEIRDLVPHQPIIFITGHGNKLLKSLKSYEEGVELLTKPFSLRYMLTLIEEIAYEKMQVEI